jgi:hypothetical protein
VIGAPQNFLFIYNKTSKSLGLYRINPDAPIMSPKDFELCLTEEFPDFPFKPYLCFFLVENCLYFLQDGGNIEALNLREKNSIVYDFEGQIT